MANPNRKMATIRRIDSITHIPDADRIECAHIGGWTVVVGKNEFQPNDIVVYFEIDTFLPMDCPQFKFLEPRGVRTMVKDGVEYTGHVLKTIRLRGTYSQGLILPLSEFPEIQRVFDLFDLTPENAANAHTGIDSVLGVWEYYKPLPPGQAAFTGKTYDPEVAPRTDAERIQNISQDQFDLIKRCEYYTSIKVDGMSMTMVYDPRVNDLRLFTHNNEIKLDIDLGQISYNAAKDAGIVDFCNAHPGITVQYELCGPKIQSDRLKLGKYRAFAFSVFDMTNRKYMNPYEIDELKACLTPLVDLNLNDFATPENLIDYIDGFRGHVTKNCLDEGIVVHVIGYGNIPEDQHNRTRVQLERALGMQAQMKIINNKYLLKN